MKEHTNTVGVLLAIGGLAILVATVILDTRLAPFVGALFLLGGIAFGIYRNKMAGKESFRKAERATRRRQKEMHEESDLPVASHSPKD